MRGLLIFFTLIGYLFSLIFIESELVKLEVRKEHLKERVMELKNIKKTLEFEVLRLSNLAAIEKQAKEQDFVFPAEEDILGAVK
jgi:cell division protein FtsL